MDRASDVVDFAGKTTGLGHRGASNEGLHQGVQTSVRPENVCFFVLTSAPLSVHPKIKVSWRCEYCKSLLKARGPDLYDEKSKELSDYWYGRFIGCVLWMQGENPYRQPCTDHSGNILQWNGDIFSGKLVSNSGDCDTKILLDALEHSCDVTSVVNEIEGPFSFIYYQKSMNLLYFGRDKVGRHSLLMKVDKLKNSIFISSVATKEMDEVVEVPAVGIFVLDLNSAELKITCHSWSDDPHYCDDVTELTKYLNTSINVQHINTSSSNLDVCSIPDNIDQMYAREISTDKNAEEIMKRLMENKEILQNVDNLLLYLHKSVEVRINKKPQYCQNCMKMRLCGDYLMCNHSKVGILFSGGLDSAILAVIADKYVPVAESIDLINVAFERKFGSDYEVPDRITGESTYSELLEICPKRKWNFIKVDVTREEVNDRLSHIANLVYPLNTVLDESLGCAVYFASKAEGVVHPENAPYQSPCRTLLLGMGADELFGGYMRHRTTLKHKGWQVLIEELNSEMMRISKKNLGRDDRVVSDSGRQARYPYLDDRLIKFVQTLKPWERCYPTRDMSIGLGEKMLLRLVARKLRLYKAANFPKRAFQFGSRIANSKENAKDVSNRL